MFAGAQAVAQDDADDWWQFDPESSHRGIGGTQLRVLARPPDEPVHDHHHRLFIGLDSLDSGWVRMEQCHEHLDAVPRAQIVFRRGRIRQLRVLSFAGIGAAWVKAGSVQLQDVRRGARLCLAGETRALTANADGTYSVRSGPFMRKFLDGYFPMHVTLAAQWPAKRLHLVRTVPAAQEGLSVNEEPGRVALELWFEGLLETELVLAPVL